MDRVFRNGTLILPDGAVPGQDLWIRDGIIVTAGATGTLNAPTDAEVIDVEGLVIGPGFVDIHCHAGAGAWAHEDPVTAAEGQLRHGTTSMLATTILHPTADEQVAAVAAIGAAIDEGHTRNVLGIHMEGPYLNPAYGAYKELSRPPAVAEYERFVTAARGRLRTMTIAPEIPGVTEMVHDLQRLTGGSMTFSVGHSTASSEAIDALVPAGLRLCTHLFNATGCAIEPTRYAGTREVGVDEAVLLNNSIWAEVVADRLGCHVRPGLLRLAYQVKGRDRLIVVTDATAAEGAAPEGGLNDGERPDVRFNEAGGLAGSSLTMDGAVNNLMRAAGVPLVDAWRAASHNPAAAIGELHRIGQLLPGRRGDVLIAQADDSHLDLRQVWLGGELVKDEG